MIGEVSIEGVYLSTALPAALTGLAGTVLVRRLLARTRFYTFVWHPALFDIALFVVLWWAATTWPLV